MQRRICLSNYEKQGAVLERYRKAGFTTGERLKMGRQYNAAPNAA
jgi:hypothetical protein